jgi:hypothetical protein
MPSFTAAAAVATVQYLLHSFPRLLIDECLMLGANMERFFQKKVSQWTIMLHREKKVDKLVVLRNIAGGDLADTGIAKNVMKYETK